MAADGDRELTAPRDRRRLISAQLSPRHDEDLIPFVDALIAEGRLSEAVRTGLRILQYIERTPGAGAVWRRGLILQALTDGLVGPQPPREPVPPPRGSATPASRPPLPQLPDPLPVAEGESPTGVSPATNPDLDTALDDALDRF